MSHLVPTIEYTDAAAMLADYAARRARFNRAGPDPIRVVATEAEVRPTVAVFPRNYQPTVAEIIARYRRAHPGCKLIAWKAKPAPAPTPTPPAPAEEAPLATPVPSIMDIARSTAPEFNVTVTEILSSGKTKHVARARQRVMWLAARDTYHSLSSIGRILGRDHTSVMHGVRSENERTGTNVRNLGFIYARKKRSTQ